MAEYRPLRNDEKPPIELWTRVFGVEEPFFTSLLDGGGAEDNLSLAALEGEEVVSSVHVFMRRIRDREGRPLKVGGIGSVSTDPGHRKQGHSGRLLEIAVEAMEREGCEWSFLGTGVNDHYAKYGWRTVSTPFRQGTLRIVNPVEATALAPDNATLAAMAPLYEASSATRPMATVRSERTWDTAIRYRLRPEQAAIFGAFDGDRLTAYLVVRNSWGSWTFSEVAGDEARLPELFLAAGSYLVDRKATRVVSILPENPVSLQGFASVVEKVELGEARGEMVRPIADRIDWPDLFALYGDPRGRHCDLDAF